LPRTEPLWHHQRHRRRRRLPELSRRLWRRKRTAPERGAFDSPRLQPLYAETETGTVRFPKLDKNDETRRGRRLLPRERRGREPGFHSRRFRGLPPATARHAPGDGE